MYCRWDFGHSGWKSVGVVGLGGRECTISCHLKNCEDNFFFFIKVLGSSLLSVKRGLLGEVWG